MKTGYRYGNSFWKLIIKSNTHSEVQGSDLCHLLKNLLISYRLINQLSSVDRSAKVRTPLGQNEEGISLSERRTEGIHNRLKPLSYPLNGFCNHFALQQS